MATKNYAKDLYVHFNFNKNEIKNFLIHNSDYENIPTPTQGADKGLVYYDTILDRILVWNGDCWKIVKYLDDRDLTSRENVLLEDIWLQATYIPNNITDAQVSEIVEQNNQTPTTHIPKSYSFKVTGGMNDLIDYTQFGQFYKPNVVTKNGLAIPDDFKGMKIEDGKVTFYCGFKDPQYPNIFISPTLQPRVSWWQYTGTKGSFNFIGGSADILEFSPSVVPYNEILLPSSTTIETIISVTVNGVLIYDYNVIQSLGNILIIDESAIGYPIEDDDCIRVEILNT